jgi:hypothetical protein
MAPVNDLQHALNGLAAWSRNHGIHEVRETLERALALATDAESNEALAEGLELSSFLEGQSPAVEDPKPPAKPHKEPGKLHKEPATGDASPPQDGDPKSPAA